MTHEPIGGPQAWTADSLGEGDWKRSLPAEVATELRGFVADHEANPVPLLLVDPAEHRLNHSRSFMEHVRGVLDGGCGIVVVDRLPDDLLGPDRAELVFWLLGNILARPVAQDLAGQMIIRVTDEGIQKRIGVRGYRTSAEQLAHADNSFNETPPDYVSLLGIRPALEGGMSRFVSFATVHDRLLAESPDLLDRLFQPMLQDRQGAFRPDEPQTISEPIFARDGDGLRCRYTHFTIPAGYESVGVEMDGLTEAAFDAMTALVDSPELGCELMIERGQLQVVNNRFFGHGRDSYRDGEDPNERRLLLRLWHREWSRRRYRG